MRVLLNTTRTLLFDKKKIINAHNNTLEVYMFKKTTLIAFFLFSNLVFAQNDSTIVYSDIRSAVSPAGCKTCSENELKLQNEVDALFRSQGLENRNYNLFSFSFRYAEVNQNIVNYTYAYNAGVTRGSNSCYFILRFSVKETNKSEFELLSVNSEAQCTQD